MGMESRSQISQSKTWKSLEQFNHHNRSRQDTKD
uniref:Uncharacterized protein n=1 Tax=Arundo donax TaxID=35708 RepID=A0A0A9HW77_ARUDO